jgi:hypothetical protein
MLTSPVLFAAGVLMDTLPLEPLLLLPLAMRMAPPLPEEASPADT